MILVMDSWLQKQYSKQSDGKVLWDQLKEKYKLKIKLHVCAIHNEMFMVRFSNCENVL